MDALQNELRPGRRVRVIRDPDWNGPWPAQPVGVIEPFMGEPFAVLDTARIPVNVPDEERGPIREYMVRFDEPQLDADGDGPYAVATIWEKYLEPLDEPLVTEGRRQRRQRERREATLRQVISEPGAGRVIGSPRADPRFASSTDDDDGTT